VQSLPSGATNAFDIGMLLVQSPPEGCNQVVKLFLTAQDQPLW
jgi:hypothetical protein